MRCTSCFRERQAAKSMPAGLPADTKICGGCAMDIDRALGYLSMASGMGVTISMEGQMVLMDLVTGEFWRTAYPSLKALGEAVGGSTGNPPTPQEAVDKAQLGELVAESIPKGKQG